LFPTSISIFQYIDSLYKQGLNNSYISWHHNFELYDATKVK